MTTTSVSGDAVARREAARVNGRFGEQENTAPDLELAEQSPRERRLAELEARMDRAQAELDAATEVFFTELVGGVWESAPPNVASIRFRHYPDGIYYDGMLDADDVWVVDPHDPYNHRAEYSRVAEYANESDLGATFDNVNGFAAIIRVGKDATRERLSALEQEWKAGTSGRSSKQIGEDIDIAATRYLSQVAAEQGWDSIELGWDEEGRTGLRAVAITAGGRRYRAGSGDLDDHEAIWAAAQFSHPTTKMTPDHGPGPFTLTFDR